MSLKYEILKKAVKLIGLKNKGKMSAEEIIAMKKKQNAKTRIPKLRDPGITVRKTTVLDSVVLCMTHNSGESKAMLYIIGGGMVSKPDPYAVKQALRIARETGIDIFVPYYPLCTDYPLTKAYEMIYALYVKMQKKYGAENICVVGTSSGGNLALGLVPYIKANALAAPLPDYIMVLSPGVCPASDEEKQRVREIDKRELVISGDYLTTIEEILRHGSSNVPDYMIYLQNADFTGCPRVTFIYGTDEVLYAMAPSFESAMKKYGVQYDMVIGKGMYHCYPVYPLVKEAEEGWEQMIGMLRRWKNEKGE